MHFTPTGYIGLPDAVRAIWRALHGDAMDQPIPLSREEERDDQIARVLTPEAAEDHISDGREQFKESREVLLAALTDELLHAEVDEPTGAERYTVPVWIWQSSAAHTTITTGLLEIHSGSLMHWRKFHHCPCFIQRAAFDDWLETTLGATEKDVSQPDIYRTGAPGRPSIIHLIEDEYDRRAIRREVRGTLSAEADDLAKWAAKTHPRAPSITSKTIQNRLRDKYRHVTKRPLK